MAVAQLANSAIDTDRRPQIQLTGAFGNAEIPTTPTTGAVVIPGFGVIPGSGVNRPGFWQIGATSTWTVPFIEYGARRAAHRAAQAQLAAAQGSLSSQEGAVELDVRQSYRAVRTSNANLQTQREADRLGAESARIAQLQYRNGLISLTDATAAEQSALSAANDLVVAQVELSQRAGPPARVGRRRGPGRGRHGLGSVNVKNRRRNVILVAIALVAVVAVGAFAARPHGNAPVARTYKVAYTRFQTKLPETGQVQRPQTQTLAALVAGNVEHILVRPGQHVSAGQLLATIANPQLVDTEATTREAYLSAAARARTTAATNATLPAQNRSAIVQAQANLQTARSNLNQAMQDERAGAQSGLGYGGTSASQQRAAADAAVAQRATDLREAQRIADADRDLLAQKAIARNTVDQDVAKLQEAQVAYDQAKRDRDETYAQIARQSPVLSARVRASRDAVAQAEAALAAAEATAREDKSGDVAAAQADAERAYDDWRYAADQVSRLRITAPFAGVVQTIASETGDPLRPLQPGDAITAGQSVITMSTDSGFIVRTKVDEQDVAGVRVGERAIVSGEDLGTSTLPGHVATIGAVAQKSDDPSNTARQVLTTVALDGTLPYLRDGMSVDVDIITEDRTHALAVPIDAVRHDDNNAPYVLALVNGRTVKRRVRVGSTSDTQAVIVSGVAPGDVLIADRNVGIVANMAVQPTAMPASSPSPHP